MANSSELPKDVGFENEDEVYSKAVRAGRRTYFFDVKATRNDDYFITITESRRRDGKDGAPIYDKDKVFLYKEDFTKFADGLEEVIAFIKKNKPEFFEQEASFSSSNDEDDDLF